MLYQELLDLCRDRLMAFFSNVKPFENWFTWSDYNRNCYELMYENNSPQAIASVSDLKKQIPELTSLCRKCSNFFIPARNQSLPKYDVIMGQQLEESLMDFLTAKLGAVTDRADRENKSMPDCKILKPDGSVAAYFEVKFHGAPFVMAYRFTKRYCYEGSATLDHKKIEKQLKLIEGLDDAPVFYVHWIEYPCLKGVFYETGEQVKQYIEQAHETFVREKRVGDDQKSAGAVYLKKMYSPLLEMGDFESFVEELRRLING